jgi:hypothetical protein
LNQLKQGNQKKEEAEKHKVTISLSLSKAEVASSNNKIRGFANNALAIATLCF